MVDNFDLYSGLPDGLIELPCPREVVINRKIYPVPQTMEEFAARICYGQRLFLARQEENDIGLICRMIDGYYYPIVTGRKWDEEKALLFGNKVITCKVKDLYPIAMNFVTLTGEIAEREKELLYREPTKIELAAGIEKLDIFAELNALNFLRDAMKITVQEVLLTPYNECLVRFMNAKEIADFQERHFKLINEPHTNQESKYKH